MDKQAANTITIILSALGVVLILAGAFGIIAMKYALFLGVAAFIAGGVVKKI
ncbi:MAG TPA: hypothetical protein VNH22_14545 [Blastocatellia bacterium]|jgi:hypothetical protein|nr:hypothetical protein [Blastocatellia bacterium]